MKPRFERVTLPAGCSIRVYNRLIPDIPFEWHHHPEYELTLTLNSRGWRFIGDHIGAYESHDLALIPSDMPHTWSSIATIDESRPHRAVVVWFTEHWALQIAELCPEYAALRKLLKRSAGALSFSKSVAPLMESRIPELLSDKPPVRLTTVLSLLSELADADAAPLATPQSAARPKLNESPQLGRVLEAMHKRYAEPLRLEDLCSIGNMSERSLHRLFVRHLGENFTDYLGNLRIGRACMLLAETEMPITWIAAQAGFANLSNFNRRFLEARQMTPKAFRQFVLKYGKMPSSVGVGDPASTERSFILKRDSLRWPKEGPPIE